MLEAEEPVAVVAAVQVDSAVPEATKVTHVALNLIPQLVVVVAVLAGMAAFLVESPLALSVADRVATVKCLGQKSDVTMAENAH